MSFRHLCAACIGAAAIFAASSVEASLVISLDDLGFAGIEVIVVDNSPAGTATAFGPSTHADSVLAIGAVNYVGVAGGFFLNITTGTSKPLEGPSATLMLSSVDVSGGAGTLNVWATDTGYSPSIPGIMLDASATSTSGTVSVTGYHSVLNTEFGLTTPTPTVLLTPPADADGSSASVPAGAPFSMTILATVSHTGPGVVSTGFSATLQAVPEPVAFFVWSGLMGVAGLTMFGRRREYRS
jgi:hypothetical protein